MIQYLINATAIWLLSLVVFDGCMRRSTHHAYNRAYLVSTALLGALLPLYHVHPHVAQLSPAFTAPMLAVADVKQSIVTAASVPDTSWSLLAWITGAYCVGIAASFCMLLREGFTLLRWYRQADVQWHNGARLVVTHREHGPFSVLGRLFISDIDAYSAEGLRIILQHEGVHIRRRHYLDKALLLLLRCIFWLHPLPYIYYRRLMMVHEYEADETGRKTARAYSHFLIQQHLGGAAPLIAHSFFHSPLKNRIRMLNATQTRAWRKAAYFLALPAITAFAVLWVNNSTSRNREQHGNIVIFGGNKFEMGLPMMNGKPISKETFQISQNTATIKGTITTDAPAAPKNTSPTVGMTAPTDFTFTVTLDSIPVKMNGETIYDEEQLPNKPVLKDGTQSPFTAVIQGAEAAIAKLPDGNYSIEIYNTIVDKKGRIAFYTLNPIHWSSASAGKEWSEADFTKENSEARKKEQAAHAIPEQLKAEIQEALERSLDALMLNPGVKDGKPVISRIDLYPRAGEKIVVKNHIVTLSQQQSR